MRSVTVDRSVIEHILTNPAIVRELPALQVFLRRRRQVSACCGRGQRKDKTSAGHIRQAKISLMGLPSEKMARLKELLNADTLVFHIPSRGGHDTVER